MNENEIMATEEIMEVVEDIEVAPSHKGLKIAAGVGIAAIGCALAAKFVVIPLIAKIKAKKAKKELDEFDVENLDMDIDGDSKN